MEAPGFECGYHRQLHKSALTFLLSTAFYPNFLLPCQFWGTGYDLCIMDTCPHYRMTFNHYLDGNVCVWVCLLTKRRSCKTDPTFPHSAAGSQHSRTSQVVFKSPVTLWWRCCNKHQKYELHCPYNTFSRTVCKNIYNLLFYKLIYL